MQGASTSVHTPGLRFFAQPMSTECAPIAVNLGAVASGPATLNAQHAAENYLFVTRRKIRYLGADPNHG